MYPWDVVESSRFQKDKRKYSRDEQVCKALASCLTYLPREEDPGRMGDVKCGPYAGTYGYRLTKSIRLIYKVDRDTHQITLEVMGTHKEVYGSD